MGLGQGAGCAAGLASNTGITIEKVSLLKRNKLLMAMQFPAVRNSKDPFQTRMRPGRTLVFSGHLLFFFPPKDQLNKIPRKAHLYPFNYLINSSAFKAPPPPSLQQSLVSHRSLDIQRTAKNFSGRLLRELNKIQLKRH